MSDLLAALWLALKLTGISLVFGMLAGRVLAMSNPDPPAPSRRYWKRRRSDA